MPHKDTVMICAGGTGGHMFPALALAHDVIARGCAVVFVTDDRGRKFIPDDIDALIEVIAAGTLPSGLVGKLKGAMNLALGYLKSRRIVSKYAPKIAIGFGGYPSLPPMMVAQHKQILTVIHEANAVLGKANAYLAPKADRIALSLPDFSSLEEADAVRAVVTGNPVRSGIAALYAEPYMVPDVDAPFHIAVMGGSLGAKVMADIVPDALASLAPDLKSRLSVVQQCHIEDTAQVDEIYKGAGIAADIRPFIDDMPEVLKASHLIIARSGASTVAEVSIAGVPAVYVPYPHHADMQQKVNAEIVSTKGGAWVMLENHFTPSALAGRVESLMRSPETLFKAAEGARSCAKPEAGRKLGNLVVALIKGWDKNASKQYDYTQGHEG
ncbi:MAG: undecaprenyldiphospho-muramoylpentapeptide beta-N-acetylglucosaminyltransferase [Alphaproteobacteria bacterium]|nr:MAG: undecaprenyldiphospho-muramoylpentapeptide beta-N-acetylglucosaminyltransferase [Alphaproteobacteria bacterium]